VFDVSIADGHRQRNEWASGLGIPSTLQGFGGDAGEIQIRLCLVLTLQHIVTRVLM
jgi:hypothetical protein